MSNISIRPGVIEGFAGPMMSGKTRALLNRVDPLRWMHGKYSYIGFKPGVDKREFNSRSIENFIEWNPIPKDKPELILENSNYDLIAIDEIQFFNKNIVDTVLELQKRGKNIIFSGLDMDFRRKPFGAMPELITYANEFKKFYSTCKKCGNPAYYTQRLIDGEPAPSNSKTILIEGSGKETYEPRCFNDHIVPDKK